MQDDPEIDVLPPFQVDANLDEEHRGLGPEEIDDFLALVEKLTEWAWERFTGPMT